MKERFMLKRVSVAGLFIVAVAMLSTEVWGRVNPVVEANPYDGKVVAAEMTIDRPVIVHTKHNAPTSPNLEPVSSASRSRWRTCHNTGWSTGVWSASPRCCYARTSSRNRRSRCCTSVGWVAQALALRLMHAEKAWNHDAFFDYVDRWMFEDDAAFVKTIKDATGRDHNKSWARQGQAWDDFVNKMWAKHRPTLEAPIDGWKQKHDDRYYRAAVEKAK